MKDGIDVVSGSDSVSLLALDLGNTEKTITVLVDTIESLREESGVVQWVVFGSSIEGSESRAQIIEGFIRRTIVGLQRPDESFRLSVPKKLVDGAVITVTLVSVLGAGKVRFRDVPPGRKLIISEPADPKRERATVLCMKLDGDHADSVVILEGEACGKVIPMVPGRRVDLVIEGP